MTSATPRPAPCWICGLSEHPPTDLHAYVTEREAAEWYARQPVGAPVVPVVDGVVYSYGT